MPSRSVRSLSNPPPSASSTHGPPSHLPPHLNFSRPAHPPRPLGHRHDLNGPPSPTLSATTRSTAIDFSNAPPVIITRSDLRNSLSAFENLLSSAKAYRNAMLALSNATAGFASALEECARQKGASGGLGSASIGHGGLSNSIPSLTGMGPESSGPAEQLMAAAGLHYMESNHEQVLGDTFYKSFEIPLWDNYDDYKRNVADRQISYEKGLTEKSQKIRETEAANLKMGKKKQRDLASFRRALSILQGQVDDLDRLKSDYYTEVLEGESETWHQVAGKVALVVRSEIEVYDRFATKGSTDAVLESMIQSIQDPFDEFRRPGEDDQQIYSILPPLSILTPSQALARKVGHSTPFVPEDSESEAVKGDVEREGDDGERRESREGRKHAPVGKVNGEKDDETGTVKGLGSRQDLDTDVDNQSTATQPAPSLPPTTDTSVPFPSSSTSDTREASKEPEAQRTPEDPGYIADEEPLATAMDEENTEARDVMSRKRSKSASGSEAVEKALTDNDVGGS